MKNILFGVTCLAPLCLYVFLLRSTYPAPQTYTITKFVAETSESGTTLRPVSESRELQPTWNQRSLWFIVAVAGGMIVTYSTALLILWILDYHARRNDAKAKSTERKLEFIVTFVAGIVASYVGLIMRPETNVEEQMLRQQHQAMMRALSLPDDAFSTDAVSTPQAPAIPAAIEYEPDGEISPPPAPSELCTL